MAELVLQYPDALLNGSGKSREEVEQELRFQLAVRLFQLGEVSLGLGASMAGMNKILFMDELGKLKIPIVNWDQAEIEAELRAIREYSPQSK